MTADGASIVSDFAPLETERLLLKRLEAVDAAAVARQCGDWRVARYTARIPHPYPAGTAERWITAADADMVAARAFSFGCVRRADDRLIGIVSLGVDWQIGQAELGYWIGADAWGQGYASEAARRMIAFAFDCLGLRVVAAAVHPDNRVSARVLEKLGFIAVGHGEMEFSALGERAKVTIYEIDRAAFAPPPAPASSKMVYVAAAALVDRRARVLLAQRPAGKSMAGLWEFPGGKVEPGESPHGALARELSEELGIEVAIDALSPLTLVSHRYRDFHLLMPLYLCRQWSGTPVPRQAQAVEWASAKTLQGYSTPPADAPLIAALSMLLGDK